MEICPDDLILALPTLRKTLSTISSPAFSEVTLKLEGCPMGIHFFQLLPHEGMWRDEWGLIDRDLDDMAHEIGRDIRLVVQVEAGGGVWSPTLGGLVGEVFPLMSERFGERGGCGILSRRRAACLVVFYFDWQVLEPHPHVAYSYTSGTSLFTSHAVRQYYICICSYPRHSCILRNLVAVVRDGSLGVKPYPRIFVPPS